jgi:voltage-dependent calcium channel
MTVVDVLFLAVSFVYTFDTAVRFLGLGWYAFHASGWNLFDAVISVGSLVTTGISQAKDSVGLVMQQLQKLFMVMIAFKLVQRVDSLNKLFKTVRQVILGLMTTTYVADRAAERV